MYTFDLRGACWAGCAYTCASSTRYESDMRTAVLGP
jgi:hypothetical protein